MRPLTVSSLTYAIIIGFHAVSQAAAHPQLQVEAARRRRATPASVSQNAVWNYIGCYSDSPYSRSLSVTIQQTGSVTIEQCQSACLAGNYKYAGLEYSSECYCDNAVQPPGELAADWQNYACNMACSGNSTEICGGSNRLSLYQYSSPSSPSTTKSSSSVARTTSSAAPSTTLGTSWTYLGCYSDSPYSRSLSVTIQQTGSVTIEQCQSACLAGHYKYAGVEYSSECYCDNVIQPPGALAADWENYACNMACSGNSNEICGGSNRLSLYALGSPQSSSLTQSSSSAVKTTSSAAPSTTAGTGTGWTYLGCYSDSPYSRSLSVTIQQTGSVTIEQCQSACIAAGNYKYAGVEYSSECYCDNAIQPPGALAADWENYACNMACSGNSNEICGGSNRLSLYQYGGSQGPSSTTSTSGPKTTGTGDWVVAYQKANTALAQLTNANKVALVTGQGWQNGPCVGNTAAIPAIGYPQLCLQDGPLGVRYIQGTTAFPAGVQVASTWDIQLMYSRGNALGTESKALGIHVQLGPVGGPLGKIPYGGRGWEGFSVDPYLTGIAMAQTIKGMQDAGVQACAKHFIGNEQENNRELMSSNIPDRANHELYLWPFADAIKANVASVMCSYNRQNGTYSCENNLALSGILKGELDFQGYVMSDWYAQHSTTGSANAGMDMAMPGNGYNTNNYLWGQSLLDAVSSGSVQQSRLDDMARRVLAAWYLIGQDNNYPKITGWTSWNGGVGGPNVQGSHATVARAIARDGIVLLKNTNNALPLYKPASLAIIGQDAIVNPSGPNSCNDRACDIGTLAMGWGSGSSDFPYLIAPYDALKVQAAADGTTLITSTTDSTSSGASAASAAATAIVFINSDSGEGYLNVEGNQGDRINLDPWHSGNDLVQAVANANQKTIVVIHSVGPVILESILANPNVVAILWAGIPGQESGNGLVDILYGSTSPSGKLPYTIAKQASDYGTNIAGGDDSFSEGLYIDYRHFDKSSITPRYEFGYGLSYTTFTYSSLTTAYTDKSTGSTASAPGGAAGLYDIVATVTATITNSGSVTGAEVAQLYIGLPTSAPDSPIKQLRGFQKISLASKASGKVTFSLRRKDLSYWNVAAQQWTTPSGTFTVSVGASSRDIRLTGTM